MGKKNLNIHFSLVAGAALAALLVTALAVFMFGEYSRSTTSPVSGRLTVGADRALQDIVRRLGDSFSSYYTGASISVEQGVSPDIFSGFASGRLSSAMLHGGLTRQEKALLEKQGRSFRCEPVARNAAVVVANADAGLTSLDFEYLRALSAGKGESRELRLFLDRRDLRFHYLLLRLLDTGLDRLVAHTVSGPRALVDTVASDRRAIAVLPLSDALAELAERPEGPDRPVLVPLSAAALAPLYPDQSSIYAESYPLVYTICYLYDTHDALATGFGAWMARQGQKTFMRSSLAPFRIPERRIELQEE